MIFWVCSERVITLEFQSSSKDSEKPETKSSSNLDFKAVSNDDPLWAFGQVRDRQSPVQKYLKPLPKGLDEEKVNLQTTCKFEDTIYESGPNKKLYFYLVSLLSGLFGLSRFWQTLYPPECNCSPKMLCEAEEFENASITTKVWRQLQDPLCILSGNIPNWLTDLAKSAGTGFWIKTHEKWLINIWTLFSTFHFISKNQNCEKIPSSLFIGIWCSPLLVLYFGLWQVESTQKAHGKNARAWFQSPNWLF